MRDGNSCIGCSFQSIYTDRDGSKLPVTQTQQFGVNFVRLQLPFVIYGLAKMINYVEDFHFAVPKKTDWYKSWTPIIPNSQIKAYPESSNTDEWKIEILVNPTNALYLIIIMTFIITVILIIAILVLDCIERVEDSKDGFEINPI